MTPEAQLLAAVAAPEDSRVEELEQRIAELAAAVEARDTFIAVAAHELRNPMTPIVGQVEFLLFAVKAGRCSPEQVEQRLERIHYNVHRFVKRAGVLLDVSRLNGGKLHRLLSGSGVVGLDLGSVAGRHLI